MSRVVNVSNRVALPKSPETSGGLAVGLLAAMQESGGLWFGSSGRTHPGNAQPHAEIVRRNGITFAALSLPGQLYDLYYNGFANGALWPLLHSFLDRFRFQHEQYEAYLAVNRLFARELARLLKPGDLVWVHDYHLIPLGGELRALGVTAPVGFFLHIPFPHFEVLRALPTHQQLLRSLLEYDVVGFQTEVDRRSFVECAQCVAPELRVSGTALMNAPGRVVQSGVFPIGIDRAAVAHAAMASAASSRVREMATGLQGRRLIVGIDRLDYSKGLLQRFEAYQHFLETHARYRGKVTYLQIAQLGRQKVRAYSSIRRALERSAGSTNGRFAEVDWTPIRYLNRTFAHATAMGLLRLAQVCLVTPLRDGMNLVAKEFVAAQDPADPGVLVLSDRAGAANELSDALIVNPYDTRAIAQALARALDMPLAERRARHAQLIEAVDANDIHAWRRRFVAALEARGQVALAGTGTANRWTLRAR